MGIRVPLKDEENGKRRREALVLESPACKVIGGMAQVKKVYRTKKKERLSPSK